MAPSARTPYDGIVITAPVTIPYRRYSINSAHWWIGRAIREVLDRSGLRLRDIDGLSVSSFTLGPDTAVGLTQHFGLSAALARPCAARRRQRHRGPAPLGARRAVR